MTYTSGERYVGQWCGQKREGSGALDCSNGDRYVGQWVCDRPQGAGRLSFRNGNEYAGGFSEGLREGNGVMTFRTTRNCGVGSGSVKKQAASPESSRPSSGSVASGAGSSSTTNSFSPGSSVGLAQLDPSILACLDAKYGQGVVSLSDLKNGFKMRGTWQRDQLVAVQHVVC